MILSAIPAAEKPETLKLIRLYNVSAQKSSVFHTIRAEVRHTILFGEKAGKRSFSRDGLLSRRGKGYERYEDTVL